MAIVVLKPTPLAAEYFHVDPETLQPSSQILSTEEYGDQIIPYTGQEIHRSNVTLIVISVDIETDDGGNDIHRAIVGLKTEVN